MKQLEALVSGKVQGVFFRDFVAEAASVFRVTGFVRNEPDGAVRIVAQGGEVFLKKFLKRIEEAPHARIDFVAVHWKHPTESFNGFEIQ